MIKLINLTKYFIIDLQLDPSSRQALIEAINNDINRLMSNEDSFINELLKGAI